MPRQYLNQASCVLTSICNVNHQEVGFCLPSPAEAGVEANLEGEELQHSKFHWHRFRPRDKAVLHRQHKRGTERLFLIAGLQKLLVCSNCLTMIADASYGKGASCP